MGSREKGFRIHGYPPDVGIVEAKEWDGSDGFSSGGLNYVNSRAKDWLERTHSSPAQFVPALLNVEGAEDKHASK